MELRQIDGITNLISQLSPSVGGYWALSGQMGIMDYSVRLSYSQYLRSVTKAREAELEGPTTTASFLTLEILANARFFFESLYGFVYMFEKLSKSKVEEPLIPLLAQIFKKYQKVKMPRVKISKDHFNALICAEGTGDKKMLTKLTGDSAFLYEFSTDMTGMINFQGELYDPHMYFRLYGELLHDLKSGLEVILKSEP